jgi:hypothetical protein
MKHRRTRLSWFLLLGLLGLLFAQSSNSAKSKPATPAFPFQITPFLSCIEVNGAGTEYTAYFGYESKEADIQQIVIGAENRFVPPPANRQQPSLFFPGYHERAFRVTNPFSSIVWVFNGHSIIVDPTSAPRCTPPPVVADIVPFVENVTVNGATATVTFGYQNASSNTITIAAGTAHNRLSRAGDQTQPTQFLPGLQRNVYTTTFPAAEALYWMVQGMPALAVPGTCPTISIHVR